MSTKSMSALPTYSFNSGVCPKKGGGCRKVEAFHSQGTQSYENGVWGYYRTFRFGQVVAFFNGEEIHFRIRQGGKVRAGLKVVGDKFTFYQTGRQSTFRRGAVAIHYFRGLLDKLMLKSEATNNAAREVLAYLSFFCAHMLPQWDQPKEGVTFDDFWGFQFKPTWNKLLFPLMDFKSVSGSQTKAYKVLRGQKSLKSAAKAVFGVSGKHHTKLLSKWLSKGCHEFVNNVALLIKKGCDVELASSLVDEGCYVPSADYKLFVECLLAVQKPDRVWKWLQEAPLFNFQQDTSQMLGQFPGLKIGREVKGLEHLHDVLSYMVNNSDNQEADLWSHPEFRVYEGMEVGGYTVRFPDKISDIKYWGSHLSICVGGYGDRIHTGVSVVFALYKDDKPVVCVEIDGESHRLCQVYGARNTFQPPELSEAIKELMLSSPKKVLVDRRRELRLVKSEVDLDILYKKALYETSRRLWRPEIDF